MCDKSNDTCAYLGRLIRCVYIYLQMFILFLKLFHINHMNLINNFFLRSSFLIDICKYLRQKNAWIHCDELLLLSLVHSPLLNWMILLTASANYESFILTVLHYSDNDSRTTVLCCHNYTTNKISIYLCYVDDDISYLQWQ